MSSPWPVAFSMIGASGATGAQGGPGVSIYNGAEIPSNTGAQGDYFINNNTRDIYTYSTNTWNNLFSPEAYFSSVRTNGVIFSSSVLPFESTFTTSTVSTFTSTFLYTGSPAAFTIPQGASTITFQVLGGGGANAGGGGAYVTGSYVIQPGDSNIGIYVGQGGKFAGRSLGAYDTGSNLLLQGSGGSAYDPGILVKATTDVPLISSPKQIAGLNLWLDAKDVSASGTNVEPSTIIYTWSDKSENGQIPGVFADNSPLMGSNAILLDGTNLFHYRNFSPNSNESGFIVLNVNSPNGTNLISGGQNGSRQFSIGSLGQLQFNTLTGPTLAESTVPVLASQKVILSYVLDTSTISLFQDGIVIGQNDLSDLDDPLIGDGDTYIGGNNFNGNLNGSINEVLLFSTNLSKLDRQQVEGYLGTKWNLLPALSLTNPYSVDTASVLTLGGGGGGASGILFPDGSSMLIAAAGAGGFFDGVKVYQGGAGGIANGSEPSAPEAILVSSLDLATDLLDRGTNLQTVTVNGTVPFSTIQGIQCVAFNNGFLTLPYTLGAGATLTVSFWMYPNANGTPFSLTNSSFSHSTFNADINSAIVAAAVSIPSNWTVVTSPYQSFGKWTHVAYTIDSSNYTCKIYINGVYAAQGIGTGPLEGADIIAIGRSGDNDFAFNGYVAKVGVYNKALGPAAVLDIYNTQGSLYPGPPPLVLLKAVNYSGSGAWADESGNGKNASLENGVIAKNADGNGIVLDGSTSWTFPNVAVGNAWTVNVWYKNMGEPSGGLANILVQLDQTVNLAVGYGARNLSDTSHMAVWSNFGGDWSKSYIDTPFKIKNGEWINIQGTWDGTYLKTYINSVYIGSIQPGGVSVDGGTPYAIGRRHDDQQYVVGEIGEVRIYNYPLKAYEVLRDYNSSYKAFFPAPGINRTGLQLWLDGKDPLATGTAPALNATVPQWFDKSGKGRNSTSVVGAPTYTAGGIAFDHESNYVFPVNSFPSGSSSYSVYMILNLIGENPYGILYSSAGGEPGRGIMVSAEYQRFMGTDWNGSPINNVDFKYNADQTFLYETFFKVGQGRSTYQNATLSASNGYSTTRDTMANVLLIGTDSSSRYLYGTISEIIIYNTAHTIEQRQDIEGYLAWKWNIQSKLPVGHPYLDAAPTLASSGPSSIILSANPVTQTSISVSWTGGTGVTQYRYKLNGNYISPSTDNGLTSKLVVFSGLQPATTYTVEVIGFKNGLTTVASIDLTTSNPGPPSDISGISSNNVTSSAFTITWTGGLGYHLVNTFTVNGTAKTPSYSSSNIARFTGLIPETSYTAILTSTNQSGSVTATITVSTTSIAAPLILLRAINYSGSGAWADESGNSRNATIENGTAAKNADGNGIVLDGSTNWTFPNVGTQNVWTVNVWVKHTGTDVGTNPCIITQIGGIMDMFIGVLDGYQVGFYNGSGYTLGNRISLPSMRWVNIQGVWDGTQIITYVNGSRIGSVTGVLGETSDNGSAYRIGRRWDAPDYFVGEIGEVSIYNFAFTREEVTYKYNQSLATFPSPPPSGFSPTSISGAELWLDGSDPLGTGSAPSSGTSVTTWSDKSGNSRSFTGSGTYNATTNGIALNGSSSNLFKFSQMPIGYTGTVAMVLNINHPGGSWDMLIQLGQYAQGISLRINGFTGTNIQINTDSTDEKCRLPLNNNSIAIFYFTFTGSETATIFAEELSGSVLTAVNDTFPSTIVPGNQNISIGSYDGVTGGLRAQIHELVYYNTVLGTSDQNTLEGYLAWKWGLEADLPSNHPYYDASP